MELSNWMGYRGKGPCWYEHLGEPVCLGTLEHLLSRYLLSPSMYEVQCFYFFVISIAHVIKLRVLIIAFTYWKSALYSVSIFVYFNVVF